MSFPRVQRWNNPAARLVSWLLEPHVFLVLRLVADFATAIYLLVSANYLVSVWFFIVGVATVLSERKAVRVARQ